MNELEDTLLNAEAAIKQRDGAPTFFDLDDFPWTQSLQAQWPALRAEADAVLSALHLLPGIEELQPEQIDLSNDRRWKIFPLYAYGNWASNNLRRCPATARAILGMPGLQAAMFSVLEPRKSLPSHRGVYGGMLRYHLGIRVPQPASQCGISVGGQTRHWDEGRSLIFDDSHEHSAWNHSDEPRVILLADFTRPVAPDLRDMNDQIIQALRGDDYVVKAVERWNEWEALHGSGFDAALEAARGCTKVSTDD